MAPHSGSRCVSCCSLLFRKWLLCLPSCKPLRPDRTRHTTWILQCKHTGKLASTARIPVHFHILPLLHCWIIICWSFDFSCSETICCCVCHCIVTSFYRWPAEITLISRRKKRALPLYDLATTCSICMYNIAAITQFTDSLNPRPSSWLPDVSRTM